MADHYEDYTREQLLRLLRERDKRPRFHLCELPVASFQFFHLCMTAMCNFVSARNREPKDVVHSDLKGNRFATITTLGVRSMGAGLGQERIFAVSG